MRLLHCRVRQQSCHDDIVWHMMIHHTRIRCSIPYSQCPSLYSNTPLLLLVSVAGMSMPLLPLVSRQHVLACCMWSVGQSEPHVITARSSAGRSNFWSPHFHTTVAGGRCDPAA